MRATFAVAVDPIFEFALRTIAQLDRGGRSGSASD